MKRIAYIHANSNIIAGQEKVLLNVIKGIHKKGYSSFVILPRKGIFSDLLFTNNIEVKFIKMVNFKKRIPFLFFQNRSQIIFIIEKRESIYH